jgi:O-succinylhomoserine sulfhydrylase
LLKGLETLQIRLEAQSSKALQLALWLEKHPRVGASTIPACRLTRSSISPPQQKSGGAIVSFTVKGGRAEAWKVVDSCRCCRSPPISATPRPP